MQLSQELREIIAERNLLKHPFYHAWSKGELSQEILKNYASQYYSHVESFPRFISRVHSGCPDIAARKVLLQNLVDEELHGTDHPALWMQFAEGLGATRETVVNEKPITETQELIDSFFDIASRDWRDGLCALFAYESQVPDVSVSKIDGLKRFYGITDEEVLKFFTVHQEYDVEHANQVAKLVDRYADRDQAVKATREAADSLWHFLDGMCRVSGIQCEMN